MNEKKTTVAIEKSVGKSIKRLAFLLEKSQGEIVKYAIMEYENNILANRANPIDDKESYELEINKILKAATEAVWKEDPQSKQIQLKLLKGAETIDDFILNDWDMGLNL